MLNRAGPAPPACGKHVGSIAIQHAAILGSLRPAVSQHLKVLKTARLVCDRPAGTRRVYQLDPTGLAALRTDLDRFWTRALTGYAQLIDSEGDDT